MFFNQNEKNETQNSTFSSRRRKKESIFGGPIVETETLKNEIVHQIPDIKRKKLQLINNEIKIKKEINETQLDQFNNIDTKNDENLKQTQNNLTQKIKNDKLTSIKPIGFVQSWITESDDKPDYIFQTDLDGFKKKDQIIFTDLLRKDKPKSHLNKKKYFKKARQGRFFYQNIETNLNDFSSSMNRLNSTSIIYPCTTLYINNNKNYVKQLEMDKNL